MNKIWFTMIFSSIGLLIWTGPEKVLSSMIDAANFSLKHIVELCGIYAVWLGILELVDASGLGDRLAKFLHPVIKKLFKLDDKESEKLIALNLSANILGLGNAATPMGMRAMKKLDDGSSVASPAIIMLIVMNATSIQLLPTTIIGMRSTNGSFSPGDIIIPTLIATIFTCLLGITLVKLCQKMHPKYRKEKK